MKELTQKPLKTFWRIAIWSWSKGSVEQTLKKLCDEGKIKKEGVGKATFYHIVWLSTYGTYNHSKCLFFSQFISLLIISLPLFEKAIIFSCLLFKKLWWMPNLFDTFSINEYAYLHDVIQCLKAYWIGLKLRSHFL